MGSPCSRAVLCSHGLDATWWEPIAQHHLGLHPQYKGSRNGQWAQRPLALLWTNPALLGAGASVFPIHTLISVGMGCWQPSTAAQNPQEEGRSSGAGAKRGPCHRHLAPVHHLHGLLIILEVSLTSPPILQYMGCIEVLRSMRSLDFNTRTQVTR